MCGCGCVCVGVGGCVCVQFSMRMFINEQAPLTDKLQRMTMCFECSRMFPVFLSSIKPGLISRHIPLLIVFCVIVVLKT